MHTHASITDGEMPPPNITRLGAGRWEYRFLGGRWELDFDRFDQVLDSCSTNLIKIQLSETELVDSCYYDQLSELLNLKE
jgi:hypothetical protein